MQNEENLTKKEELQFEFAKFTDVTTLAKTVNPEYNDTYVKIFLCPDVTDFWLCRVIKDINEEYENSPGTYLLEQNNIPKENKTQKLTLNRATQILKNDDFTNYDIEQRNSLEEIIEMVSVLII